MKKILLPLAFLLFLGAGCGKGPSVDLRQVLAPIPAPPQETGITHEYEFVAKKTRIELKPGVSTEVWAYNGTVPGPEIRLKLGDRVKITLKNDLEEPTTIHWHGIRVPQAMDGVPMVSQEPVPPGGTFVYEFTPPDAGTYFYHSHVEVNEQVDRGLYGAFVVDPAEGMTLPDGVFALDDWLLDVKGGRLPTSASEDELDIDNALDVISAAAVGNSSGHAGHMMAGGAMMGGSQSAMMDHNMPAEINGRFGNVVTVNGKADGAVAPIRFARGERFIARFLNASNAMTHQLRASDGREFTIVAVDGVLLDKPFITDHLVFPPAKRFDVAIEAQDGKSWAFEGGKGNRSIRIPVEVKSEVGAALALPSGKRAGIPDLSAAKPHATFTVSADDMMRATTWQLNGRAFDMHGENPLMATFELGTWVKLRFENASMMAHTMHIHGHFMYVIARNGQRIAAGTSEDTVVVRPMEMVEVAMLADNLGDWVVHCHNLDHEEHGLMAKFNVE